MSDTQVHDVVQARYGAITSGDTSNCCGSGSDCCDESGTTVPLDH